VNAGMRMGLNFMIAGVLLFALAAYMVAGEKQISDNMKIWLALPTFQFVGGLLMFLIGKAKRRN